MPKVGKLVMKTAIDERELDALTVIYPGRQSYQLADNVECVRKRRPKPAW